MGAVGWIECIWTRLTKLRWQAQYGFKVLGGFDECDSFRATIGFAFAIVCKLTPY